VSAKSATVAAKPASAVPSQSRRDRPDPEPGLRELLVRGLAAPPFDHRAAVVLRDVEGLSNAEVAEALGISVAAAKSRIHRGRMQIRDALANWEEG
jgi:RNA polymerase sigma-70 factor (ECF subfamily)